MTHEPRLRAAAADARYLLERGYGREQVLTLVGNHYNLDRDQRELLRRGVYGPSRAAARRGRLLQPRDLAGTTVGIDGHNVLITIESALQGRRLVLADDGLVRDIAGQGRHHRPGPTILEAARLMVRYLVAQQVLEARVWLDAPLTRSGELAAELRRILAREGLAGHAQAVPVPERHLKQHRGPVATSDSALIDAVAWPVDLAGLVIRSLQPPPRLETL